MISNETSAVFILMWMGCAKYHVIPNCLSLYKLYNGSVLMARKIDAIKLISSSQNSSSNALVIFQIDYVAERDH